MPLIFPKEAPFDFFGFGELMQRFTAPIGVPLSHADSFVSVGAGGAEANAIAAATLFGGRGGILTALPLDSSRAAFVENAYRSLGLSNDCFIHRPVGCLGMYFYAPKSGVLPASIEYNREYSSFSSLTREEICAQPLPETRVFTASGVTAAIKDHLAGIYRQAENMLAIYRDYRARGTVTGYDVNPRVGMRPADELKAFNLRLFPQIDILYLSLETCSRMFDQRLSRFSGEGNEDPKLLRQEVRGAARYFCETFGVKVVALTDRRDKSWQAFAYDAGQDELVESARHGISTSLGRVGSGDAGFGAFVGALASGHDLQLSVEYLSAAVMAKLGIAGDVLLGVTREDLDRIIHPESGEGMKR